MRTAAPRGGGGGRIVDRWWDERTLTGGKLGKQRMAWTQACGRRRDARLADQLAHVTDLVIRHQGNHRPGCAGARRTAGAMQVRLVLDRRISMDDKCDVVDVDA